MTATASAPPVAVRHRRVGRERLPVPALDPRRASRSSSSLCRSWGCCGGRRGATSGRSSPRTARCTALRLSLWCSLWATVPRSCSGCRWPGFSPGSSSPAAAIVRALCTLSMVLPPVVAGVALFYSLGRRGLLGQYLDRWFGFTLPFTTAGVVVAQTFVAMPFLVHHGRGGVPPDGHPLRGGRPHPRRRRGGTCSAGSLCRRSDRASSPARCSPGPGPWASSVRRSPSPETSPAAPRPCHSPSTSRNEVNPEEAIVLSLVLIAVSFGVLVGLRDRFLGGGRATAPTA